MTEPKCKTCYDEGTFTDGDFIGAVLCACAAGKQNEIVINFVEKLEALTELQRLKIFDKFCQLCGRKKDRQKECAACAMKDD